MTAQVVILAAGRGARLGTLSADRPKCLVELAGRPLLEWQLDALSEAGLEDIGIVTGYMADRLSGLGLRQWHNPRWAETNMVASLLCADAALEAERDLVVAYADIVYEPRVVRALLTEPGDVVTVIDRDWLALWRARSGAPLADAETLVLDDEGHVLEIGGRPTSLDEIDGQYIGLTKFTPAGKRHLVELLARARDGDLKLRRPLDALHFTDALAGLVEAGQTVQAAQVRGGWLEVDTPRDLAAYEALRWRGALARFFAAPEAAA